MMSEACRTLPWSIALEEHTYRDVFAMHVLVLHDVLRQLQQPLHVWGCRGYYTAWYVHQYTHLVT